MEAVVLSAHSLSSLRPQPLCCPVLGPVLSEKHCVGRALLREAACLVAVREQRDRLWDKMCPSETPPGGLLPPVQLHVPQGPLALNGPVIVSPHVE